MKVAIASYGFAEYCIQQANGLVRNCDVLLLLPRGEAEEYRALLDPAVKLVPFASPRLRQPVRQLLSIADQVRQIRRFRPHVLHLQHGHLWFNLALPWLRSYPLVTTIHDPRHHVGDRASQKTPQAVMDFGFRRANQVIVHGQVLKRQVNELLGIAADRIHVIPHVALGPEVAPATGSDTSPQILFFGRIWKYKGLEYLIRAQPLITAAFPEARIVIAGAGEDFEPYRRQMVDPDRFIIRNHFIEPGERDELFRQASIVVLPYIEATQSGVVPLAYACATPVIATRTGALSEAVEDGRTGLLVPPADSDALARAVIELLGDPTRRRTMGMAGRSKLDAECAPAIVARQTIEVYQRAIDDRQCKRRPPRVAPLRRVTLTQNVSECAALPTQHQ
jgi:glycosyltransferase involved in cell wall biosynthesis